MLTTPDLNKLHFKKLRNPMTGEVFDNMVAMTDEQGTVWTVPKGHRHWDTYDLWLAAGKVAEDADPLPTANS